MAIRTLGNSEWDRETRKPQREFPEPLRDFAETEPRKVVRLDARIRGLVVETVYQLGPESSVYEAVRMMLDKNISCLLVSGKRGPVGVITERDILRRVTGTRADPAKVKVGDVMSSPLICVGPETSVGEAARVMVDKRIRRLVVLGEDGTFIGLLTMTDLVRWVAKQEELSESLINFLNYKVP